MISLKKHWRLAVTGAISLFLIIMGMAAASYYLNSTAFRQRLLDRLNTDLAGKITVGHHRLSLAGGKAVFDDIVLTGPDGTPLAVVDRLQVRLFLPVLVRREIRITSLSVEMAQLQLSFDHQDRLKLIQALSFPGRPPSDQTHRKPWLVRIDDFGLMLDHVNFQRPARQLSAKAAQIKIAGGANLIKPAGEVEATMGRLAWKGQNGKDQILDDLTIAASYAPSKAQPMRLEMKIPDSLFSIQGAVDWQSELPQLDLSYSIDMDLARIQAHLPADLALAGRAKGQGMVIGPLYDPDGTLRLEITDPRIGDIALDRLGLDLKLARRKIVLAGLQVRSPWGDVDLTGDVDLQPMFARDWREATAGLDAPGYDLKITGRDLRPGKWPKISFPLGHGAWLIRGHAAGRGVKGPKSNGRAEITLETTGGKVGDAARTLEGDLSARLVWRDGILGIEDCDLSAGPNRFKARGHIDLAHRQMDLRGTLDMVRMDDLGAILDVTAPTGQGKLTLHGHGDIASPTIRASLMAREITWEDWTVGRVLAESELGPDGVLTLSRFVLENQGSLMEGQGTLALLQGGKGLQTDPAIKLALEFEQLEPDDFYAFEPLGGHFNGRLDLGGTLQHLTGDLELAESPLHWRDLACLAQGRARWADGRLTIPDLHLSKDASSLQLQGSALLRDPMNGRWMVDPRVHAQLQAQAFRLKDIGSRWSGLLDLQAQVDGPVSNMQGRFSLEGDRIDFGFQKLHALKSAGRLRDHRLHIDRLTAGVAAGQDFKAHGWYGFDRQYAFSLEGAGIELTNITVLQQTFPVAGLLNLYLNGSGTISKPNLVGDLEVRGPRFRDRLLDDFRLQLRMQENQIDLDADLNFAIKGRGVLDSGEFNFRADFDRSDLSPYLALGAGPLWSGRLSGAIEAAGNWHTLEKARMKAALTDVQLNYQNIGLISADKLKMELQDGDLLMPETRIQIMQQGHLALQASGALQGQVRMQADGRISLAALAPFSEILTEAEGDFEIHARAKGPLSNLDWEADLTLEDMGMAIPGLSQSIRDLNGEVKVNSRALMVESLSGTVDSGGFSVDGRVRLEALRPVRGHLNFSARTLPLQWPDTMDVVLHGDLRLDGKPRVAVLAGNLDLVEGTYYKDVRLNLISAVTRPKRRRTMPSIDEPPPWMEAIRLDVTVGYRNPLLVENNLANLKIAPNLRLIGTLARPVLNGRAEVTDGELIYRRKSFAVERGVVDFINPYTIEPTLDILSAAQIRKWQVSLAVTGTPDQLQLKLSSDPPEADSDILSLILLGRTNEELVQGEGGDDRTTTQMLATLLATAWGEDVKKTTGLDILELETGALDESDSQDRTQLTVGKKMSRRLTLKYALESNQGDMIQKAISEYRFLEHLLVSGFQDSGGDYGGELLFRIEFD